MLAFTVILFIYNFIVYPYCQKIVAYGISPPEKADFGAWRNVTKFCLRSVACLWVGFVPHNPVKDQLVFGILAEFKNAIKNGDLECSWKTVRSFQHTIEILYAKTRTITDERSPSTNQFISTVALALYAKNTALPIPEFLSHVDIREVKEAAL